MKVLLLGEFSGMHHNLSVGLKELGVDVTLASDGDAWKNYERDIDLARDFKKSKGEFLVKVLKVLPKLSGYDIVQLNSYKFLYGTPFFNEIMFKSLTVLNKNVFLGAHGMDPVYINYALAKKLKYSVFQIPEIQRDQHIVMLKDVASNSQEIRLNNSIAKHAKGIVASAVGYYQAYSECFPNKIKYIPLSIDTRNYKYVSSIGSNPRKIKFFLGLMNGRVKRKGTDVILRVLKKLEKNYPSDVEVTVVHSVPFKQYQKLLNSSHVLCDQLYAYGIGLNGIIGLSKGLIVAGGADEDMYEALGEYKNRPIIDINTTESEMLKSFEFLLDNKKILNELSLKSRDFVVKHHDSIKVAQEYLDFWKQNL